MLSKHGYTNWESTTENFNNIKLFTRKWQSRIDIKYPEAIICSTNNKLFLNITEINSTIDNITYKSFEIYLTAGLEKNDLWSNFKIYSISEEDFFKIKITDWEQKFVNIWNKINSEFNI